MISLRRLIQSFKDAARGLAVVFKNEQNFRIQIIIAVLTLGIIIYFPLKIWEIVLLIWLIVMVLVMELLNSAVEKLSDLLKPRMHHYVGAVKDIMAGAVLLSSLGAAAIGLIIVLPHFYSLIK